MSELVRPFQFVYNPTSGVSKQRQFFFSDKRFTCFSGGYGNGKSLIGCKKAELLLATFPGYRFAILRSTATDLDRTTRSTFFQWCNPALYSDALGGKRADSKNYCKFINGSEIFWLHLDKDAENVVKGLEINGFLIDQAEEIPESIYDHLTTRLGRWSGARVPQWLQNLPFERNAVTGDLVPPSYGMVLCNPEGKDHWIYQRYHPESEQHHLERERTNPETGKTEKWRYSDDHVMIQASSYDNPALTPQTIATMEAKGEVFRKRFVLGEWGIGGGSIHIIPAKSKLRNVPLEFINKLITDGKLFRAMDHGDSAPTCCIWGAVWDGKVFIYREYYQGDTRISDHRENIAALSGEEEYRGNFADPAIFKKTQQKLGGIYSLADEYKNIDYPEPPLYWTPSDNSEFLTRSRIEESLQEYADVAHPITGIKGAPKLYFIMSSPEWPNGCDQVVSQTEAQKRDKSGTINGEEIFSDDRDESVTDHAYDALRYLMVSIYARKEQTKKEYAKNSYKRWAERASQRAKQKKRLLRRYAA